VQKILNIPERKWKTDIKHHRQANDLRARLEVAKWAAFCHPLTLGGANERSKKVSLTLPPRIEYRSDAPAASAYRIDPAVY